MSTPVQVFHLGPEPDSETIPVSDVRKILAVLSRKTPDSESVSKAIQTVIDNPNQMHAVGVFKIQFRVVPKDNTQPLPPTHE